MSYPFPVRTQLCGQLGGKVRSNLYLTPHTEINLIKIRLEYKKRNSKIMKMLFKKKYLYVFIVGKFFVNMAKNPELAKKEINKFAFIKI